MNKATFAGIEYEIVYLEDFKDDGECDDPRGEHPQIRIDKALEGKELLEAYLHESGHACDFAAEEWRINGTAEDQAEFLWKLGYRRTFE